MLHQQFFFFFFILVCVWRFDTTLHIGGSLFSLARDHMSNERTMLSYIRTAISLASAGVGEFFFFVLI